MKESAIVTIHNSHLDDTLGIIDYSVGTPVSVKFNFERIWRYKKYVIDHWLHFYRVRQSGFCDISELDINCMEGLYCAFRKDFLFSVITFDNEDLLNVKHEGITYLKTEEVHVIKNNSTCLTKDQLLFLKYLSYGETSK